MGYVGKYFSSYVMANEAVLFNPEFLAFFEVNAGYNISIFHIEAGYKFKHNTAMNTNWRGDLRTLSLSVGFSLFANKH